MVILLDHTYYRDCHLLAETDVALGVRLMPGPHKRKQGNIGLLPRCSTLGLTGMPPFQIQLLENSSASACLQGLGNEGIARPCVLASSNLNII